MKKYLIALFLGASLLLTGCTSADRLHDTSYLRAVMVEGGDKKTLTLSFFSDEDSVITVTGGDIESAKRAAELESGRLIFTGYTELVILGDCESREVLEFLLDEWKLPPSCITAHTAESGRILEKSDAERLCGSIKRAIEQGLVPECGIVTVLSQLIESEKAETPELTEHGAVGTAVIGTQF